MVFFERALCGGLDCRSFETALDFCDGAKQEIVRMEVNQRTDLSLLVAIDGSPDNWMSF